MSQVHVVIVRDDCVFWSRMHYRAAKKVVEQGTDAVVPLLKSQFLDAGYVIIDTNKRRVINGQHAFAVPRVKGMDVVQA